MGGAGKKRVVIPRHRHFLVQGTCRAGFLHARGPSSEPVSVIRALLRGRRRRPVPAGMTGCTSGERRAARPSAASPRRRADARRACQYGMESRPASGGEPPETRQSAGTRSVGMTGRSSGAPRGSPAFVGREVAALMQTGKWIRACTRKRIRRDDVQVAGRRAIAAIAPSRKSPQGSLRPRSRGPASRVLVVPPQHPLLFAGPVALLARFALVV
jgi:hypothetical protein